ncbi:hypothetical protein NLG97_g10007 [Lecanicillium saksenae]|uniref:Uncharacterized protein n=1 Tax=Lecanicillium saksenae TaxID=468837 RepID=A0ACC1QEF3_9HYPO|nr:hypothetical protein NLG97_g10007 [Lecanicillium saksenae]
MGLFTFASETAQTVPMTTQPLVCPAPVLTADFDSCSVPGGIELWQDWGYYSPGICFIGYVALCTQTTAPSGGRPISIDETAVRCVPFGYDCNDKTADQRFATSLYNGITLSAPAFEIRWRSGDVKGQFTQPTSVPTKASESATFRSTRPTDSMHSPPTSLSSEAETGKEDRSGMSAGKIAGIVIGVGAAMCVIVAIVFIMQFRPKYGFIREKLSRKADRNVAEGGSAAAELADGTVAVVELHTDCHVRELDSNRPKQNDDRAAINSHPAELHGDSTARLEF